MAIQWFPGHMTAARDKAAQAMERVDVVIEVLDARCPEASSNPMIAELRAARQRPSLKLLNKSDLADPAATREWLAFYSSQRGTLAAAISCKKAGEVAKVPGWCRQLAPHRGVPVKPLRMMIMGVPNVGKSTLMNALLKRKVARVGDEPAVTRSQQMLDLGAHMTLTDTPGLMWPKIEHASDGLMLAACHAIGRNALIEDEVAVFLAQLLLARYPQRLAARYGLEPKACDAVGVIEAVARRRGRVQKGGGIDHDAACAILLQDFREGALGRISLETPETRRAMLDEAAAAAAAELSSS